ncbi:hypothetical protein GCM10017581_098770 [Dactylosporangium matsuzakiense]|uniref:Type III restriction/modification enzyme restriction subunit n=1 Tax=Dactylosporangium matsuzakiense TaxID=53360 RepID=A0A9W6KU45_9ACTN|nr:hypothetical protein GCM10017581_098770 [Dactylosporangium matsuzakiense]
MSTAAAAATVVVMCSDATVAQQRQLRAEAGTVLVSTGAERLAAAAHRQPPIRVFSTYTSLPVIAQAHRDHDLGPWDLVVIDEAHRTADAAAIASSPYSA